MTFYLYSYWNQQHLVCFAALIH